MGGNENYQVQKCEARSVCEKLKCLVHFRGVITMNFDLYCF